MRPAFEKKISIIETLRLYQDKRLAVIFLLGISSGFPWVLIGSAMSAWLKDSGLSRTNIGLFGAITAVYAINFMWSPLVDRVKLPFFTRHFGQRRSWIFSAQIIILVCCICIATTDPSHNLYWTGLFALLLAFASATQDVAIDAYRIEIIPVNSPEKIPLGSAMATAGWWTGYQLFAAPAFFLAGAGISWNHIYLCLVVILLVLMLIVVLVDEPQHPVDRQLSAAQLRYQDWLEVHSGAGKRWRRVLAWFLLTTAEPVMEFFRRNGLKVALVSLAFIFSFKLGEAFLGRMSIVFYKEIGFTDNEIGTYSKLVGWVTTIVFSILGSLINARFGIIRGLFIGGISMAATNLMFSWIAIIGPDTTVFAITIVADGFTSAFSTVAFVAFISLLTNRTFTATQYAIFASLGNLGRTLVSSTSGISVDFLGGNWALFFIITALMVIPSLLLLMWLQHHLQLPVTDAEKR